MEKIVTICEMAPRDGMQVLNRNGQIPIAKRIELIKILQRASLKYIEVGSFVKQKIIPAMKDTSELMKQVNSYNGQLAALVPNIKYFHEFEKAPNLDTVALFLSASEYYSLKNTKMTIEQAINNAEEVVDIATKKGYRLRAHLSGAFRDLTQENRPTKEEEVAEICSKLRHFDPELTIALADTDGRAKEDDIERVLKYVINTFGSAGIAVHLHNRNGDGLKKVRVAFDAGVNTFDSAIGGIGGNQKVLTEAVGNVATEEIVNMFETNGVKTGIDQNLLLEAGKLVIEMTELTGDPLPPSKLLKRKLKEKF